MRERDGERERERDRRRERRRESTLPTVAAITHGVERARPCPTLLLLAGPLYWNDSATGVGILLSPAAAERVVQVGHVHARLPMTCQRLPLRVCPSRSFKRSKTAPFVAVFCIAQFGHVPGGRIVWVRLGGRANGESNVSRGTKETLINPSYTL